MDQKAIGIMLVIGAAILFANSVRERRQGHISFSSGFIMGGVSVVLLVVGLALLSS
jgi:uncharacterized membrane protein YfcA